MGKKKQQEMHERVREILNNTPKHKRPYFGGVRPELGRVYGRKVA